MDGMMWGSSPSVDMDFDFHGKPLPWSRQMTGQSGAAIYWLGRLALRESSFRGYEVW
jgi:hypothetical protein